METLGFNKATQRRLASCHLSDFELYTVVADARDGSKGAGWVWNAVKGGAQDDSAPEEPTTEGES